MTTNKSRLSMIFVCAAVFVLAAAGISTFISVVLSADGTKVSVRNTTDREVVVHLAFSPDSEVKAKNWQHFCKKDSDLTCHFTLAKNHARPLPIGKKTFNATIAFDMAVGCGATKAEFNVNNPAWYDLADVSLVDGFNKKVSIAVRGLPDASAPLSLGPPKGREGNEDVFGLYPLGCDICVARQSPPCGIGKGKDGCKAGTQYEPKVPCQFQGPTKGGGSGVSFEVVLHGD